MNIKGREDRRSAMRDVMGDVEKRNLDRELRRCAARAVAQAERVRRGPQHPSQRGAGSPAEGAHCRRIETFAKSQGYDLILGDGVLYAAGAVDVTGAGAAAPGGQDDRGTDARPPRRRHAAATPHRSRTEATGAPSRWPGTWGRALAVASVVACAEIPSCRSTGRARSPMRHRARVTVSSPTRATGGQLAQTRAARHPRQYAEQCPVAALIAADPHATHARVAALLHPPTSDGPASIRGRRRPAGAVIAPSAAVGPCAVTKPACASASTPMSGRAA